MSNRSQIGIMLQKRNLLTSGQLQELYRLQQVRKEPFIKLLLEKDWVFRGQDPCAAEKRADARHAALPEFRVDPMMAELVPKSFCERQLVVPLKLEGRRLTLAVADPLDNGLIDDVRFTSGLEIRAVMASPRRRNPQEDR